jgi:hypothetical protein
MCRMLRKLDNAEMRDLYPSTELSFINEGEVGGA